MDRAFTLATAPPRHRVLGIELEPLTLGHVFILHEIGNPLPSGEAPQLDDIGVAVAICSQPWQHSKLDVRRWWFRFYVGHLGAKLAKLDVQKEAQAFWTYFSESLHRAFTKQSSDEKYEMLGTPWFWSLLAMLRSRFHMSEDEALSYPVVRARAICTALDEMEGRCRLTSKDDEEMLAAMDSLRKESEAK